jgi:UDPglucose 6-dehydrogenase
VQAELAKAFDSVDAVVLATEWREYRDLDPQTISAHVSNRLIIDGRNVLDVAKWQQAGFRVLALGRTIQN